MQNKKLTIEESLHQDLEAFHTTLTRESAPHIVAVGEISLSLLRHAGGPTHRDLRAHRTR